MPPYPPVALSELLFPNSYILVPNSIIYMFHHFNSFYFWVKLSFHPTSTSHSLSCLDLLVYIVMNLLFTDFSLFITRLLLKHSIYPLFAFFHSYYYISSPFLKSLFSDVLSLLLGHIYLDYLLNLFYFIFLCS